MSPLVALPRTSRRFPAQCTYLPHDASTSLARLLDLSIVHEPPFSPTLVNPDRS
jgi:hypothetical protein